VKTSQLSDALLHGGVSDQVVALQIENREYNVGVVEDLNGLTPTDTSITAATFSANPITGMKLAITLDVHQDPNGEVQLYLDTGDGVPAWYDVAEVVTIDGITVIRAGEVRCVG